MKRAISAILSLLLIVMFVGALVGCGADIKAENEKLKTENTNLKSDNDKIADIAFFISPSPPFYKFNRLVSLLPNYRYLP